MKIQCPSCAKENNLNLEAKVVCGHCKKELSGFTYSKPLISVTTALIIGAGGFYAADSYLEQTRYPILEEYAIVESCASSYKEPLTGSQFKKKRAICICALDITQNDYSLSQLRDDELSFINDFNKNANKCM